MIGRRLDPSQQDAASIKSEDRQIVLAGPGAGKSEVVGALARNLVDSGTPPDAILVISFSRAAVDVVRRRTEDVTDEGEEITISTIDSLVARVIRLCTDDEVPFRGYDRNIEIATTLLADAVTPVFEDVDHVIVDEMQDIVGVRAGFVEALLIRGVRDDTGFTLLGDPLQSIYGFADGKTESHTWEDVVNNLQDRFDVSSRRLTGEYRARTREARALAEARPDLLRKAGGDRLRQIRSVLSDLVPLGAVDEDAVLAIRGWQGTTALLCDTNIRAALVAEIFASSGTPVETAESSANRTLAAWLSDVFAGPTEVVMTRNDFLDKATHAGAPHPLAAWKALVTISQSRRGLDVGRMVRRLAGHPAPPELVRVPESDIIASTVHRAKGLEFDNVVLVDPDRWRKQPDPDDEARLLFVAASRARARLTLARGPETKRWSKSRSGAPRWELRPFPRAFPDGTLLTPADFQPISDHTTRLPIGTLMSWRRAEQGHADIFGHEVPAWEAMADERIVVATTTIDFGNYLNGFRQADRFRLRGGRLFGWETRIVSQPDGSLALRRAPRIAGQLTWERT